MSPVEGFGAGVDVRSRTYEAVRDVLVYETLPGVPDTHEVAEEATLYAIDDRTRDATDSATCFAIEAAIVVLGNV